MSFSLGVSHSLCPSLFLCVALPVCSNSFESYSLCISLLAPLLIYLIPLVTNPLSHSLCVPPSVYSTLCLLAVLLLVYSTPSIFRPCKFPSLCVQHVYVLPLVYVYQCLYVTFTTVFHLVVLLGVLSINTPGSGWTKTCYIGDRIPVRIPASTHLGPVGNVALKALQ